MLNFIPLLSPNERMVYGYIALGYLAENHSFYASLRAGPTQQDQEPMLSDNFFNNGITEWRYLLASIAYCLFLFITLTKLLIFMGSRMKRMKEIKKPKILYLILS